MRGTDTVARLAGAVRAIRFVLLVYLASRVLLLVVALAAGAVYHESLASELGRWDGSWYLLLASHGYPTHVTHTQNTLGFLPLYPMMIWAVVHAHTPLGSSTLAGVLIAMIGGLIAAVLVQRLANGWWGEAAGRRAVALFCFFPGSIVFSMVYSEGLSIPLAAGCILALERRRWLLAGLLAGCATAVTALAVVLVPVCALCAVLDIRRRGWRDRSARRSLLAPLLSVSGISLFAVYLWAWTGTPFATLNTQRYGWNSRVNPLALVDQERLLTSRLSHSNLAWIPSPSANLLGAAVLAIGLVLLLKRPRLVSVPAIAWAFGVGLVALVSENVTTNPRVLITAFPVVIVYAYYCRARRFGWLLGVTSLLLGASSWITYGQHTMTP